MTNSSTREQVIKEGKRVPDLLTIANDLDSECRDKLLDAVASVLKKVEAGAEQRSEDRAEPRRGDDWQPFAGATKSLLTDVEKWRDTRTPIPVKSISDFIGALEDADESPE